MKTITLTILLSLLCSVGWGHNVFPTIENPEAFKRWIEEVKPGFLIAEEGLVSKSWLHNLEHKDMQEQINNLKVEVEELRKMVESKHAPKDAVNRYECGCRP